MAFFARHPLYFVPIIPVIILSYLVGVINEFDETETLSNRIESLTTSLNTAARAISEIEEEINSRQKLVSKLEEDSTTYSELAKLKKPEVEAVAQTLREELRREGRASFKRDILIMLVGVIVGTVISNWFLPILQVQPVSP
ncbi:hypothetical protein [Methanothrix harundinacea]|uniref:hypothetical protein n=1 Tax=Methanothrix harundinacea TaxID=301375 RepID=UPI00117D2A00|nr:hypothetical protein [Methanothrix harundinacea]